MLSVIMTKLSGLFLNFISINQNRPPIPMIPNTIIAYPYDGKSVCRDLIWVKVFDAAEGLDEGRVVVGFTSG
jgi:hypothetical protein